MQAKANRPAARLRLRRLVFSVSLMNKACSADRCFTNESAPTANEVVHNLPQGVERLRLDAPGLFFSLSSAEVIGISRFDCTLLSSLADEAKSTMTLGRTKSNSSSTTAFLTFG